MTEEEKKTVKRDEMLSILSKRDLDELTWKTICSTIFPGANPQSVLLAVDYCRARGLDIMKKPCHIVPMKVKDADGEYRWRDVVLPGIYEYRTTAQRTKEYLGHSKPEYGEPVNVGLPAYGDADMMAPEWCEMTVYRWNALAAMKCEFTARVYFVEAVATKDRGTRINERWSKAPIQMLTKCTEAAALREAFPEALGGEPTMEEMVGQDWSPRKSVPAEEESMWRGWSTIERASATQAFDVLSIRKAEQAVLLNRHREDKEAFWNDINQRKAAMEAAGEEATVEVVNTTSDDVPSDEDDGEMTADDVKWESDGK